METSYPFGVKLLGSKGSIVISPFPRYCNTSASERRPTSRGNEWRGLILPPGIRNETVARDYLSGALPRKGRQETIGENPMCALLRDRKPVEENGDHADPKPRRFGWNSERSQVGPQVVGFPIWRAWLLR